MPYLVVFLAVFLALPGHSAWAQAYPPPEPTTQASLRCAEEGLCLTAEAPGLLAGACRVDDEEVRFDVFAHAGPGAYDVTQLQWADWCGRIVDQDGTTVTAVYGHESCLDLWIPDWRQRLHNGVLRGVLESQRFTDATLLDCLGHLMDASKQKSDIGEWMILRALAHASILSCVQGP